jgi:hypothetical protein
MQRHHTWAIVAATHVLAGNPDVGHAGALSHLQSGIRWTAHVRHQIAFADETQADAMLLLWQSANITHHPLLHAFSL